VGSLSTWQREHQTWQDRNFPDTQSAVLSFIGMVEEMGEIAHALLKHQQGIRGLSEAVTVNDKIVDGHCDLIIFSFGLANAIGYSLEPELKATWHKVKARDWVKDPERGGE
jgi:NTP pyrophosphatase (non-canonical NTP hydrolase)